MWPWFRRPKRDLPVLVQAYMDTPQPDPRTNWREVPYSVIDVETSGLNAKQDALLAIGLVEIDQGRVRLDSCWYSLIRPPEGLLVSVESIRIHRLLRDELAQAPPAAAVLTEFLQRLRGRMLVVHVATIDMRFINRVLTSLWGIKLHKVGLDTARFAHSLHVYERYSRGIETDTPSIQLRALTQSANLPLYTQHNALNDAITTAQLFLMQSTRLEAQSDRTLRAVIRAAGT